MRKIAGSTPPYPATTIRDFSSNSRLKKPSKTITTATKQNIDIASSQRTVMNTTGKSLAWEAYRNELEFE